MSRRGKVYIIGAGPGDPGLFTIKGLRALQEAEVIIYDHLVSPVIVEMGKGRGGADESPPARLIYAGKEGGDHTLSQEEINRLLVTEASQGRIVARLKGGDPFIFGRGGEEAEVLSAEGIDFEIIPGVTSAVAAPAYAGIPLTHRRYSSSVAFVTGHEDPTKGQSHIDWSALVRMGTLVFLMGVKNLPQIVSSLLAAGQEPSTPAALIRWGTTPRQETLVGTLEDLVEQARARGFRPPALLVVGQVVSLRAGLNWFEKKPLFGKTIVVTRPKAQAEGLAHLLEAQGARVIYFPVIEIVPPANYDDLDAALERIGTYNWLIFTSVNGVRPFFQRLKDKKKDIRDLQGIGICTIGPVTARAVEELGLRVDIVPESYLSEGIVQAFAGREIKGQRFLLPRAAQARAVIPQELTKRGATVHEVVVYRTVSTRPDRSGIAPLMERGEVDIVTFTSPSTVRGFMEVWGENPWPRAVKVACLGPVTAQAALSHGLKVDIMQEVFTMEGLVEGIKAYVADRRGLVEDK